MSRTREEWKHQLEKVTKELLHSLGVTAEVTIHEEEVGLRVDIESPDSALLIGWHGGTLTALEYLTRSLLLRQVVPGEQLPEMHLDVEGYKKRQIEELVALASRVAENVRRTGLAEVLRPMNSFERRIIHVALKEQPDIETESTGMDPNRRIVVKVKAS